jgi:acetyl-CoA carboxylase carboxyltransferase component
VHTTAGKLADLERRRYEAVHAGSAAAVEKQHARGKLTARERIALLLDEGTSHMFITGPDVIKTVTGEDVTFEEPGPSPHCAPNAKPSHPRNTATSLYKGWTSTMPSVTIQDSSAGNPVSTGTRTVQPALES